MKAVVIRQHGEIGELAYETSWPDPVAGEGEVVIAVSACALNYHDLFTLRGMPGIKIPMPIIMGIDVAGEIAEVGPGVSDWKVGDRVMVDPLDTETGRLLGERMDGGLAEYCKVGAHMLVPMPEGVSFREAAALPVAYGTAYRMMVTRGKVAADEKLLVLGASGGVGTCCVQLGRLAGAHVIAAASTPEKLARLAEIGAHEGIDYKADDFMKVVHERHGKPRVYGAGAGSGGVDVVVNFTGGETWVPSLRVVRQGGRILTCGATAGFDPKTDLRYIWTFEIDIRGSNAWERGDLFALLDLVQEKRLAPTIDCALPLKETPTAFSRLAERNVFGKIIIESHR
ncbi:zinc-binding dehydrogenase [Afifella sp. IM 167]|uniref:zinc-binding dehydrogenase n=1 Tax=Afifella sp. IM 167 TaxID=2033586 RepID=UPI001CCE1E9D|nr:zinc-binding dehydrogenase [Afifella sp. IM 167]MBZ8134346.1 zinc-binding dehydrogenase [Afifella sp. IM 167]